MRIKSFSLKPILLYPIQNSFLFENSIVFITVSTFQTIFKLFLVILTYLLIIWFIYLIKIACSSGFFNKSSKKTSPETIPIISIFRASSIFRNAICIFAILRQIFVFKDEFNCSSSFDSVPNRELLFYRIKLNDFPNIAILRRVFIKS